MLSIAFSLPNGLYAAQDLEPITLHYMDRPPYAISSLNDQPTGVVAEPTEKVFRKAKIPFVWAKTPLNRQFALIKENRGLDCAIGLEQTVARSEFGKFTNTVYVGKPLVAIVNQKVSEKCCVSLVHMLNKHTILVKENFTQGEDVTKLILASDKKIMTSAESVKMVQMIAAGRADFMMISHEEVEYYLNHHIVDHKKIRVLELSDVHKRFHRRIMCSKSVDDKIMAKLDRAINL